MSCIHFNNGTCSLQPRQAEVRVFARGEVQLKTMKWYDRCRFAPTRSALEPVVVRESVKRDSSIFDVGVVHLLRNSGLAFEHCLDYKGRSTGDRAVA